MEQSFTIEVITGDRIVLMVDVTPATRVAACDALLAIFRERSFTDKGQTPTQYDFRVRVRGNR